MISIILLSILGYNYYNKIKAEAALQQQPNNTIAINHDYPTTTTTTKISPISNLRDSLQRVYIATVNQLDSRLDSITKSGNSEKQKLDVKMTDFYKLRNDIITLLKDNSPNADLTTASYKISELQHKVEDLKLKNTSVEDENKRLSEVLANLTNNMKMIEKQESTRKANPVTNYSIAGNPVTPKVKVKPVAVNTPAAKPVAAEKPKTAAPEKSSSPYLVSGFHIATLAIKNDREIETSTADLTEKLVGSIDVNNNFGNDGNAEFVVVVTQPDGHILKKSAWETGTFDTRDGRRVYSCKMQTELSKGESKKLKFSINADSYQKGNYTMQVYHDGQLIGKAVKTLQ